MLRKSAWPTFFAVCALAGAGATAAPAAQPPATLPTIGDANLKPQFTHVGGADPQATDRTVPHWFSTVVDPLNHQTYGYNMVGADPGTNGSATIPVDVVPLSFSFASAGGASLDGTSVVPSTLASPIFQTNDYSTTTLSSGGAGALSAGNVGQYGDAVMRSQFNKVGSAYHLRLATPTVLPDRKSVV